MYNFYGVLRLIILVNALDVVNLESGAVSTIAIFYIGMPVNPKTLTLGIK